MRIVWTALPGLNRGRYFLMTGQRLTGQEALTAGVVGDVLPPDGLNARAWALARQSALPQLLTAEWKRKLSGHLHTCLTYEALADLNRPKHAPTTPIIDLLGRQ